MAGMLAAGFVFAGCTQEDVTNAVETVKNAAESLEKVTDADNIEEEQKRWENTKEALTDKDNETEIETIDAEGVKTYLLVGVDSREDNFTGRSDTMILVSVNEDKKKVVMTSVLRDIYADIPGYGKDRLNAAYAYGGSDLLTETLRENFGITADAVICFNFYAVRDIVDGLGGIELTLTADEISVMNGYIVSQNEDFGFAEGTDLMDEASGTYTVNGNQALAYARIRYIGTDFARVERQRTVIRACLTKAKELGVLGMASFIKNNYSKVQTDMTLSDIVSLVTLTADLSEYEVTSHTIPVDGTWSDATVDGMAVLSIDFEANAGYYKAWIE